MTRVLLVDPVTSDREIQRAIVVAEGFDVTEATTAAQGLALARSSPRPDVIVIDQSLPDASGLDLLRALAQHPATAGIPVVVTGARFSSAAGTAVRMRALWQGAKDYQTKPLDRARFLRTIRTLVDIRVREPSLAV